MKLDLTRKGRGGFLLPKSEFCPRRLKSQHSVSQLSHVGAPVGLPRRDLAMVLGYKNLVYPILYRSKPAWRAA